MWLWGQASLKIKAREGNIMLKQKIYVKRQKQSFGEAGIASLCRRAVKATLHEEGIDIAVEVEVLISDDKGIAEINHTHRGKAQPTDVLSFPTGNYTPGAFSADMADFNPETGCVHLGDIVLSNQRAVAQAREFGHETNREIAYLVVHATLHLLGYDHQVEEEKAVMRKQEEQILQKLGLMR